jgi:NADPH:quinone reductase
VNPGDFKKREDAFGVGMPYPRVILHSDGSGTVDAVGEGVSRDWMGRRVWCYGLKVTVLLAPPPSSPWFR